MVAGPAVPETVGAQSVLAVRGVRTTPGAAARGTRAVVTARADRTARTVPTARTFPTARIIPAGTERWARSGSCVRRTCSSSTSPW
ncbi:hypothetical protein ABID80_001968 [Streptomyces sp. PvP037]